MAANLTGCRKMWPLLLLGMASGTVLAETLPDPTRPPAEISLDSTFSGQGGRSVDSGLQSIIISPWRRAAIINGKTVELGEKYGNAKLVEVSERGVVLQGKQGRQTLALFPGVRLEMKKDKSVNQAGKAAAPREGR